VAPTTGEEKLARNGTKGGYAKKQHPGKGEREGTVFTTHGRGSFQAFWGEGWAVQV